MSISPITDSNIPIMFKETTESSNPPDHLLKSSSLNTLMERLVPAIKRPMPVMITKYLGGVKSKKPNPTISLYAGIINPMIREIDIPVTNNE